MPEPVNEAPSGGAEQEVQSTSSGSPAGESGGSDGGQGRSLENLRGELLRKHTQLADQVSQLTAGIRLLTDRFGAPQQQGQAQAQWQANPYTPVTGQPAQGPVSQFGAPRQLGNFSDEQLDAASQSATIPPYQKELIRRELEDRRQERRFDQMFQQRDRAQRVNSLKQQSEVAANASFPALRDPSSEFSRRVESELSQQRQEYGEFPTDRFDVANRVARAMGLEVTRAVVPGYTAPAGGGDRVEHRNEPKPVLNSDEIEELSRKFAHTLPIDVQPNGRSVRRKFDKKKIADMSREYGQVKHAYHGQGGLKVGG